MSSTGEPSRLLALDGLRGVAVLLVLVDHALLGWFISAGPAGVSVFFVLSGFLITTLLLDEHRANGHIHLRRFYLRRLVRLGPALVVFLAVTVSIGLVSLAAAAGTLSYAANWLAFGGLDMGGASHVWSLAVEEQFYVVWPLLLIGLLRLPHWVLRWACAVGAMASIVARCVLWDPTDVVRSYVGTDTNAAGLLLGCLVAVVVRQRHMSTRAATVAVPFALVGLAELAISGPGIGAWLIAPAFAPLAAAVLVYAIASGREAVPSWLEAPWLMLVGRRSYALYLWHFPLLIVVVPMVPDPWHWPAVLGFLGLSWVLALASWRYVEAPCLARFGALVQAQQRPSPADGRERTLPRSRVAGS